jgi:hypothetical protein
MTALIPRHSLRALSFSSPPSSYQVMADMFLEVFGTSLITEALGESCTFRIRVLYGQSPHG